MVQGWPQGLPLLETYRMDQGYISVRPTVRIRREALQGGRTRWCSALRAHRTKPA